MSEAGKGWGKWARRWVPRIGILALGLGGLAWLLVGSGLEKFGDYVMRLGWVGIVQLLVLGVIESVLDAAAFHATFPKRLSLLRVLGCNQAGAFVNRYVPFEAGEVVKGALFSRYVDWGSAVSGTVVWNYVAKLSKPVMASIALVFGWLTTQSPDVRHMAVLMMLPVLASFVPYILFRIVLRIGAAGAAIRGLKALHILRKNPDELLEKARNIDKTIRGFYGKSPRKYWLVLAYQLAARAVSCATLVVVMMVLDPEQSVASGAIAWAGLQVMSYLVALFPTKVGTTEASGYALFAMMGLDPVLGLTSQIVLSVKATVLNLLLGVFAFVPGGDKRQEPKQKS